MECENCQEAQKIIAELEARIKRLIAGCERQAAQILDLRDAEVGA